MTDHDKPMSMVERVELAIDRVFVVFGTGDHTGNIMRWVIWDQNQDTDESIGWAYIGPVADLESDNLEKPPGDIFWKLKELKARAAISAMREPTRQMADAAYERQRGLNCAVQTGLNYSAIYETMIDAALSEKEG